MDEVRTKNIEIELNQEKIDYMNYTYSKEITCWKKAALDIVLTENEEKKNDRFSTFKNFFNS